MEGRTALVVAHRLSTVAHMDQLVVLDRGQVAEKGAQVRVIGRDASAVAARDAGKVPAWLPHR